MSVGRDAKSSSALFCAARAGAGRRGQARARPRVSAVIASWSPVFISLRCDAPAAFAQRTPCIIHNRHDRASIILCPPIISYYNANVLIIDNSVSFYEMTLLLW